MWSLIFERWGDRDDTVGAAFQAAFGDRGCLMFLARNSEKHAPCELAANLTQEEAAHKAALLRDAGVAVEVVPTAAVTAARVKHRAAAFWPTHRASNGERFTERGPVVVRGASLDLDEQLQRWHQSASPAVAWGFELGYNHEHPTNRLDRHGLRRARERGAEIGAALTECFPDRRFLIDYRDAQVSFCQFTEQLPQEVSRSRQSAYDACFCAVCERTTPCVVRTQPDTEFPHARFGDCAVCGNEVILAVDHEVVLASETARSRFPALPVPIDAWGYTPSSAHLPSSFAELKAAVLDRLHPTPAWRQAAIRRWLGGEPEELERDQPLFAQTLLQIEELSALLLAYRARQLSLPLEAQDRSELTPERLGIARSSPLYHPARRALLYEEQHQVIAQHRRLFARFHELDLPPNPAIELSLYDGVLTLRSDVFVWGVFLRWHDAGKLPDNGFDLLPGIPYSLPWDEGTLGSPAVWRTGNSLIRKKE